MVIVEIEIKQKFEEPLLNLFNSKLEGLTNPCVIVLDIESVGGEVRILEAMEQRINQMKNDGFVFATNVDNYAYSCGFMLFLLGDIKTVSENAELMHHSAGVDISDRLTAADAKEIYDVLALCDQLTERIIFENTEITQENYRILKKNDTFLDRTDLINLGIMKNEYNLN